MRRRKEINVVFAASRMEQYGSTDAERSWDRKGEVIPGTKQVDGMYGVEIDGSSGRIGRLNRNDGRLSGALCSVDPGWSGVDRAVLATVCAATMNSLLLIFFPLQAYRVG